MKFLLFIHIYILCVFYPVSIFSCFINNTGFSTEPTFVIACGVPTVVHCTAGRVTTSYNITFLDYTSYEYCFLPNINFTVYNTHRDKVCGVDYYFGLFCSFPFKRWVADSIHILALFWFLAPYIIAFVSSCLKYFFVTRHFISAARKVATGAFTIQLLPVDKSVDDIA